MYGVAWYTANSASVSTQTVEGTYDVASVNGDVTLEAVKITLTVTPSYGGGTGLELTDGDGNVGGVVDGGGAVTNPKGTHNTVGTYSVTAITFKQSNGTSDLTTEQKNYLAGKTAVFTDVLSGKGQVQLVSDEGGATEVDHDTLTIAFAAGFDATLSKVTCTFTHGKFCVRANNESGLEYVKASGEGSTYSTNVIGDTSTNGSSIGQKGFVATGENQYKIMNWSGSAWEDNVGKWLHDADKLEIGQVEATPTV